MKRSRMILFVVLALSLLLLVSLFFGKDTGKANVDSNKKATQITDAKKQAAPKGLQEPDKKKQGELKTNTIAPQDEKSTIQIKPIEQQDTQMLSTSAARDRGRQIKWQILSSGSSCGYGAITYWMNRPDGCKLCGTVGQLAVGPGSSESFGVNAGFWQESLQGYIRGDVNNDLIIDLGDVLYLISYLYKGGPAPDPLWLGDCTCDIIIELGDLLFLISYLYKGGPPPSC
jgi:hypothetical protein